MLKEIATVRAVLFDFDGTLADSYDAITASVNHVRAANGLAPLSVPEVRRHVGHGPGHLLSHTVGVGDSTRNETLYRLHHPTVMNEMTRLLDGAREVLERLQRAGKRLALCSNKPIGFTRGLLVHLDIAGRFDAVLGPEDVRRAKPAPDMLLAGLDRLGVDAAEALYVGDMTVDITTAGSDERSALAAAGPDRLLDHLADLPALLGV
jgi:phosphoglycolate phosphatase